MAKKGMRQRLRESLKPAKAPDHGHTAAEVVESLGIADSLESLAELCEVKKSVLEKEIVRSACARGELACSGFRVVRRPDGRQERELVYTPANGGVPIFAEELNE